MESKNDPEGSISIHFSFKLPIHQKASLLILSGFVFALAIFTIFVSNIFIITLVTMGVLAIFYFFILLWTLSAFPKTITIQGESIIMKSMLFNRKREISDIIWLDLFPGDDIWARSSKMQFDEGWSEFIIISSYDAGKSIREAYVKKFNERPLTYKEYLKKNDRLRWFSSPPSIDDQ